MGREYQNKTTSLPDRVPFADGVKIKKVCCGNHHTLALTQEKVMFSWGMSGQGCLGLGQERGDQSKPTLIDVFEPKIEPANQAIFVDICCGGFYNLALTQDKKVYSWGANNHGQLGHGNCTTYQFPKQIDCLLNPDDLIKIEKIAAGEQHSAIISDKWELYTFGDGSYYKLVLFN